MDRRELHRLLKKGEIYNQYLLISDEALLIDNTIKLMKETLGIHESFDFDAFSISETPVEEIMAKYYLAPFSSERRFIVVKNLEELNNKSLEGFAEIINNTSSQNCLALIYSTRKGGKKYRGAHEKIRRLFKKSKVVIFRSDTAEVRKWIAAKIKRDNLDLSPSLIHYLVDEFQNDITGLKSEFEKIENYLDEAKTLNSNSMKDLAKGLCDFDKYELVDAFFEGRKDILALFEELTPYIDSYAEVVYALTRGLASWIQRNSSPHRLRNTSITNMLDEIVEIDRKVKRSSHFTNLMLELFFLKNGDLFRKGAMYER